MKKRKVKSLVKGSLFHIKKPLKYHSSSKRQKRKSSVKKPLFKKKKQFYFNPVYKEQKDIKKVIEKRYNILTTFVMASIIILTVGLFFTQIVKNEYYSSEVKTLTQKTVEGSSAPRGRIYDRNGNLLVDNKAIKVISYTKPNGITTSDEIKTAYKLGTMIDIDYSKLSDYNYKSFWIKNHQEEAKKKITDEEWDKLDKRQLTSSEIEKLKIERVTEEDLASYTDDDKKAAYIYTLMNTGYSYEEKVIKDTDVTDEEYALVSENISKLNGIDTKLDWERVYPYGSVFKTILGSVSSISAELKDEYLEKGYSLDDRVGVSYLEYQYEDILKGEKNKYLITSDGSYTLISEGSRGNDIVISIDIELQKAVEEILTNEVLSTKSSEANTEYYNRSFVIITDPNTGEILAMAGKQVKEVDGELKVYDYTPGILTSPVVMGSVVKGASHIVGYNTGALTIGETRTDTCVKIAATPEKCSWKYLGKLNDITALAYSSNTYQFYTAINVGGGTYRYNKSLSLNKEAFDIYRNTFAQFGLGVKTLIDLPVESLGYKGDKTSPGYLLDFAIGQYDTYTPIQLAQYISTIANGGKRMQMRLYKGLYDDSADNYLKDEVSPTVLNEVDTKAEYMDRVHQGFEAVLQYGTGAGYISSNYKPAGKTGTSQSFIDTDDDGVVDKETITTTFAAYMPYDNPQVAFVIISPDISHYEGKTSYQSSINKRIAQTISQKYFEIYQ